ncbi:Ribosome-binding factor A [Candidatus Megaera venefica]|uniref:Ribosome-binding factor A n=1 Tax=Candidatus Megaera venefica TaxID=2055910 RepID=A0ABU5NDV7_9RICK|nr:ribosome-binding factor A [Candidatus Megaera venefica]MEA0971347.1 Ribosome-binding factor A [Candidatus Megaera venefica]
MSKNNKSFNLKTREKDQSQRQLKVSHAVHSSLIECFRKGGKLDHRLDSCPLSITKVNVSSDLSIANCFFVPFNTKLTVDDILSALELSRFAIRDYVTRQVNLKYSPEIRFYYDPTFENFETIEKLLKK